ncbi:hypothetical protein [Aureivirga sp. CE67]|uniref:hypothetical protein n=1 Tax=Aureivirga sp. CE67 TaxID=1788983 RepID=UPI0018CB5EF8|nr:hypothetical protein [Aureivirga sp. CE67]
MNKTIIIGLIIILIFSINTSAQNKVYTFSYNKTLIVPDEALEGQCANKEALIKGFQEIIKDYTFKFLADNEMVCTDGVENIFSDSNNNFLNNSTESIPVKEDERVYKDHLGGYLDLKNQKKYLEKNSNSAITYKEIIFIKDENFKEKVKGYQVTKYVSSKGDITVYTSKEIPWYIQPNLFLKNYFNEGIVKIESTKVSMGWDLIEYKELKNTKQFLKNKKEILNKNNISTNLFKHILLKTDDEL